MEEQQVSQKKERATAKSGAKHKLVLAQVQAEQTQSPSTRQPLFKRLEAELGRPVISYFTSFGYPVQIDSSDVDLLESILLTMDLSKGLAIVISSPGGSGLAAERMVNILRQHSGTGEFWAVVPSRAKSAATMICMGASKILMGPTSELGPIDPQLTTEEDGATKRFSVFNLIQSYKMLFDGAVSAKGNLEPYLQQLAHYDARDIAELEQEQELSVDIAIRCLSSGMMSGQSNEDIRHKISTFLTPTKTKSHGRPIYIEEAKGCGLQVDAQDSRCSVWQLCYELYIRTNQLVSSAVSKCAETKDESFCAPVPRWREE